MASKLEPGMLAGSLVLAAAVVTSACVSNQLEVSKEHPGNPSAARTKLPEMTPTLEQGFDPYEHYAPGAPKGGAHAGHGAHAAHGADKEQGAHAGHGAPAADTGHDAHKGHKMAPPQGDAGASPHSGHDHSKMGGGK